MFDAISEVDSRKIWANEDLKKENAALKDLLRRIVEYGDDNEGLLGERSDHVWLSVELLEEARKMVEVK